MPQHAARGVQLLDRQQRAIANRIADVVVPDGRDHDILVRVERRFGTRLSDAPRGGTGESGCGSANKRAAPQAAAFREH